MTILSARPLATHRDALSGVRTRRIFALALDLFLLKKREAPVNK